MPSTYCSCGYENRFLYKSPTVCSACGEPFIKEIRPSAASRQPIRPSRRREEYEDDYYDEDNDDGYYEPRPRRSRSAPSFELLKGDIINIPKTEFISIQSIAGTDPDYNKKDFVRERTSLQVLQNKLRDNNTRDSHKVSASSSSDYFD